MSLSFFRTPLFSQQGTTPYMIGQILGVIFLVVLVIAVLRSIMKKK